jgi:hypothetical protein
MAELVAANLVWRRAAARAAKAPQPLATVSGAGTGG